MVDRIAALKISARNLNQYAGIFAGRAWESDSS
jgi:hypothetical protein